MSSRKIAAIFTLAAGACLLSIAAFYPGLLSQDSVAQLTEARAGAFADWHPPVMGELWRILDAIWPGPAGMLLFHGLLFWAGLAIIAALTEGPWVLALGLLPPVLGQLGVIWKDVGMGAALLFAVAMLALAERRASRVPPLLAAGLALFYASAVRHNAAVAVFPLCFWAGLLITERLPGTRSRVLQTLANGLGFFLGVTLLASAANFALTSRQTYPVQQILLHDLTAISLEEGELLVPPSMRPPDVISVADLAPLYSTSQVVPLYCCGSNRFPMLSDPHDLADLKRTWFEVVPEHPRAYFKHRFRVFQQMLGLKRGEVCLPYQDATVPNSLAIASPSNALNRGVMAYLGWFRNSILFRGWVYFLLSWIFLLMLALRSARNRRLPHREEIGAWAVGASGALYVSASFFIAPTCDFRMLWWTALAVLISPLMLGAHERLRIRYRAFPYLGDLRRLVTSELKGSPAATRRLCLFAHYDPANRVADAVVYYIRSLHELGLEVRFISTNEKLPPSEVGKIQPFCAKVILRKNVGIDFGSWRVGLEGVERKSYDQLVLANDSVFGPLRPLAPIFEKMADYDLWGMTDSREGGIPHLQSYFLVFGARAFQSEDFGRFWAGFRFYLRKSSYIRHCEIGLSQAAEAAKWRTGAYVEAARAAERALADPGFAQFRGHLESGRALNPTLFLWDVLIRDFDFPFLKTELPRLNRLKMANVVGWRDVITAASSFDPNLVELALGDRRKIPPKPSS